MEIAVYGSPSFYQKFADELARRQFTDPVGRFDDLTPLSRRDIRVLFGWYMSQSAIDACPGLEWIQSAGAGVDWLEPLKLCPSVTVTRVVNQFGPDMSEYALLAVLAWVKDWDRLKAQQQRREWRPFLVRRLSLLTVGILGAGSIGAHIAKVFRPLVAEVRALGRKKPVLDGVNGYCSADWQDFYRDLDVLVMVVPSTPDTHHMVSHQALSLMKRGGFVVNMGRGAVLDIQALESAILRQHLGGAALDVFETEPLPEESSLWDLRGVMVTPHISGPSRIEGMVDVFIENWRRFNQKMPMLGQIDWERGY